MTISREVFFLDPEAKTSKQSQIQQVVADAVLSGRFRAGDKLPSTRQLAKHLGVSRITVTLAFNDLVAEEYLSSRARSGYFISCNAPPPAQPSPGHGEDDKVDWSRALRRRYAGFPAVEKPADWRRFPYPFVYGQADPELFDQAAWRLCALEALGRAYAAETAKTKIRVMMLNPGPLRTRMRASAFPGEQPEKLRTPEDLAPDILRLASPDWTETGKIFDFPSCKVLTHRAPE